MGDASSKFETNATKGVKTLLGDPKKAIITLAIPMIIAMSIQTIYNFVDALFVSGFGSSLFTDSTVPGTGSLAIAAIGYVLPFFMMAIAVSTGMGVGAASAISRRIGSKDKKGADNVSEHSLFIAIIVAIIYTLIFFISADKLFELIGAGESLSYTVSYGKIIFAGSINLYFVNTATALLRGEGDAKRAMYAIVLGSVLNIILDPIFIFIFKLGVAGAAYATVISMTASSLVLIYWLFIKRDTYVKFRLKHFKFKREILRDIFRVGIPASFQQISMSITMLIINLIIIRVALAGDDGITIYTIGWRIVMLAILPILGLATATISVTGAAFGAKDYEKLDTAFLFSAKFGLIIELAIASVIFFLAPFLTAIFTTGSGFEGIKDDITTFIMISCLFYPAAALGISSSATFQGTGKGIYSLTATLLRTIVLTTILAVIFCCLFDFNLEGIWWGIVLANLIGSFISLGWAKYYVNSLKQRKVTA